MKKLFLLTVACVMVAVGAGAQNFNKGDWFLDAQLSDLELSHSFNSEGYDLTGLNVKAGGGYFVWDKVAVDASLGLRYSKSKDSPSSSTFSFGVGARYYPVWNLFARIGYNGSVRKSTKMIGNVTAAIGYDLFVFEHVFFEPAICYTNVLPKGAVDNIGLQLGIGVKF